ncbi:protein of unknown function [Agreia sp. COWG]|nr:protein of unknown function [Agreia sp. COWG]
MLPGPKPNSDGGADAAVVALYYGLSA